MRQSLATTRPRAPRTCRRPSTSANLLTDDSDIDGDTLTVSGVSNATGGSVVLDSGTITFTPDADLCGAGAGSFDYTVSDGNGGTDTGEVTVDVTCTNDAPVAVDDTGNVTNASGATDFDVLVNDTDVEHNSLSLVSASVSASAGSASVVAGKVRFTPLAAFSGPAVITYAVSDGALQDSGTLTVTVGPDTVLPVATAPTVTFGSARVDETAPLHITWSATDTGSGVASYEVQASVAGGAFTTIYSGPGTSLDRMYPFNKSLVWRVRATDAATNVSDWATSASRKLATVRAQRLEPHVHRHVDQGDLGRLVGHRLFVHHDPRQARHAQLHRTRGPLHRAEELSLGLREGVRRRHAHRALQPPRVHQPAGPDHHEQEVGLQWRPHDARGQRPVGSADQPGRLHRPQVAHG